MAADPLLFYPAAPNRPPSDPAPDDPRKVKFLCSFGGQIIPRPSDGALRYAGGQTRIISVRRDAPLPEIMNKMAEVFGGQAALRYQLPDVDLDALVSVSSPEDLENMMEEYDKIAEASPDGSAKLRVFLFSPSDLAADPASLLDLEDYSQRYVEAVNRISSDGSLRRKDSLASASSAHNSGGGIKGGTSPEILSPTAAAANDSSRLFFVGAPSLPDPPVLPANPPATASNATPSRVELSPYTSQPYADPNQFQYMNSQPMGTPLGSLPISPLAIPPPQYQYAPVASHVGTEKSVPAIVDSFGGRTTQLHGDPNSRAANQLVSQLLPVPPTYLQPQNVELYGVRQVVPPPMQGQGYRLEDCYMCQKALPHAHSDTLVQEHGSATSEASTTFHSLRAEDATRLGTPHRVIAPPMTESIMEPKVAVGPFVSYGFPPVPEVRHDNAKLVVSNVVSDHSSALRPPAAMGLPSDTQASSGMFVKVPQYCREDSLQKQQQQSLVQPQSMVKQDGIAELYRNSVYPVKNVSPQATEALNLGHVPEFPPNRPGPLEGMLETLRVSPFGNSVYNEERKPAVTPNHVISKELKPENVPLVEINHPVRPQVGGNTSFMGSGLSNPSIMQEGSYARPVDQLLASSLGFTQSQNLQPTVSSQVSTQDNFFFNHETGREPMVPSKILHAMPAYSCIINPVQTNNNTNTVLDGDLKDEASRYSKDMLGDFAAPTSIKFPFPFPNSSRPNQQVELFDEPILPDSLFPSQDPKKISGGTNFLPPRPIRVASRESIAKDLSTENLSIANQGPDIALLLDDNVFYQPSNSLIKDSCREPVAWATRGSEEEQINKELQAVAEGAATAVLQSSVPPIPRFLARETKGSTSQFNIEGVIDDITSSNNATSLGDHEDTKSKPAEKLNSGFLIGDEIGRLQIIKNSDLEELKELGSGTFGTVYHGKWRGSDVAIKRINNRCFAGKPSEQERSRSDFWNEASKLSDLHHPNVVAFYGVVVDGPGGSVATVTEYMVNGSLRQALQKNDKTFDRSKRLLIAMDVAFGMEYLHSKNIVHFDLKSDNLLVNLRDPQRPICKVGDLGLSKVKCQTLISGGVRGTLPWMAPELLNGSSSLVSEKVDVFSFGIVMWEILTGKEPYADMHYGAIIGGIVSNTLRPPVPETCEPDWGSLMERCWSSEPSERPSFTEIAGGLRAMAAPPSKGR